MKFIRTKISDVFILEPEVYSDKRGYFVESFNQKKFEEILGQKINFCQDNESKSSFGVVRGLHFQAPPYQQSKLVRVISGEVLDVAVDLRVNSPTYGQSISVRLNEENKRQLFIPKGFAHGFVVLSEDAIFSYKVDNFYNPKSEKGIFYNDPQLGIDWIIDEHLMILSEKDKGLPLLSEIKEAFIN